MRRHSVCRWLGLMWSAHSLALRIKRLGKKPRRQMTFWIPSTHGNLQFARHIALRCTINQWPILGIHRCTSFINVRRGSRAAQSSSCKWSRRYVTFWNKRHSGIVTQMLNATRKPGKVGTLKQRHVLFSSCSASGARRHSCR